MKSKYNNAYEQCLNCLNYEGETKGVLTVMINCKSEGKRGKRALLFQKHCAAQIEKYNN